MSSMNFSQGWVRIGQWVAISFSVFFFSLAGMRLPAQTIFGRISGTVVDTSGAVVPGATVTIRNTETQAVRTVTTNDDGFYVAENLPIGTYSVTVNHTGFRRAMRSGYHLIADGRITANFTLVVGNVSQTVQVVAPSGEGLNTVSGEVAHVVDQEQVNNLPLNGRSYVELLTLVPGVTVTNPDQFSTLTSLSVTNQVVNGHRSNQNNLTVDGLSNIDAGANGSIINNISPDFIQEVKVETSNYSAEYGRSTGAIFTIATKSGTNQFHGGAWEYLRNDALDSRDFFSPQKTALRYNDFGYDLGGPIKRNRLFFFVGQEWRRLSQQQSPVRLTLPTTAELAGDFKGTKQTINLPGTKTPFPNDTIPASIITPDGRAIANTYKTVMSQAALFTNEPKSNNATFQPPNPLTYREDFGRVDYRFNDHHTAFARWTDDYNTIDTAFPFSSTHIPIFSEVRNRPDASFVASETWIASPAVVNEAHAGAAWSGQRYSNLGDTWQRSTLGFTFPRVFDHSNQQWGDGIPDVSITSFSGFEGPDHTLSSPTTEIEAGDTLSIVHGEHSIRTGVLVIRNRKDQNGRSAFDGNISFNASGNPNTTGYALADALLGNFNSYNEASYDPVGHYRYTEPAAFVDDSWKVSRKLTLDLGFRYEYFMAMYSTANNLTDFVPSLFNPAQAVKITSKGQIVPGSGNIYNGLQRVDDGVPAWQSWLVPNAYSPAVLAIPSGAPRGEYHGQNTWNPRVGFAYALNEKTVLRGGFGTFYDRMQGNPTFYTLSNPPYVDSVSYNYSNLSHITSGKASSAPFGTIQTINPNLSVPYSEQLSFGVQRELPHNLFTEVDYVGDLGRHLLVEPDINQPLWSVLATVPSTTNENSIRPYPGYSELEQFQSEATSNYHALQAELTKRTGNMMFTAAYTYSKVLTNTSTDTSGASGNVKVDFYNLHCCYGPATFDVTNAFIGTYILNLPKLQNRNRFLRGSLGGWQFSGVIHLQSGFPYTVGGNTPILGERAADYVGGPGVLSNPGPDGWFNPQAFAPAPQARWGTAGFGDVRGPGMHAYDLSLSKFFYLTSDGRVNLRFRSEFFNAFNEVNFEGPATNVSDSNFGTITSAYPAREIQFALKLTF